MGYLDCWPEPVLFLPLSYRIFFKYRGTITIFPCWEGMGKGNPLDFLSMFG